MVSIKYDEEAGALYFHMRKGKIARTISLGKDQFLDVDKDGKMVGLEVLLSDKIPAGAKKVISNA